MANRSRPEERLAVQKRLQKVLNVIADNEPECNMFLTFIGHYGGNIYSTAINLKKHFSPSKKGGLPMTPLFVMALTEFGLARKIIEPTNLLPSTPFKEPVISTIPAPIQNMGSQSHSAQ